MDRFAALADPTRRQILVLIANHGQLTASEISKQFESSPPAISQHLKVLRETNLVQMKKHAQQRLYTLNPSGMTDMEAWLRDMRTTWEQRFDRLEAYIQEIQLKERPDDIDTP